MVVQKREFTGIRAACRKCKDLWPAIDILFDLCPDCRNEMRQPGETVEAYMQREGWKSMGSASDNC